jgi:hypothetical protein
VVKLGAVFAARRDVRSTDRKTRLSVVSYVARGDAESDLSHATTCEAHMHVRREYPVYAEQDPDTEEWTAKIPGVSLVLPTGQTLEELRRKIEHQLPTLMERLRALSAGPSVRRFSPKSR